MTFVCRAVPRVTAAAVIVTGLLCALDTRDPAPPFKAKTLDGEKFDNTSLKAASYCCSSGPPGAATAVGIKVLWTP
jgi:hypothetical protein